MHPTPTIKCWVDLETGIIAEQEQGFEPVTKQLPEGLTPDEACKILRNYAKAIENNSKILKS